MLNIYYVVGFVDQVKYSTIYVVCSFYAGRIILKKTKNCNW